MSRINTNVNSLIAQRVLSQNNKALNTSLQRLSTGLRINSGADDPAGLIASQNLLSEQAGISTAIDNATRATNVIGTAEGGLNEVSSLLTQLQGLVSQAASSGGLSSQEIAANQLQVDSILGTINRIAGATAFQGTKLLDGSKAYTTSSVGTSAVTGLQLNSVSLVNGATKAVQVTVVTSAQTGVVSYTGGTLSGNSVTLEVSGNLGSQQLSFASGTSVSSIITAVNGVKSLTGVSGTVTAAGHFDLHSTAFGSSQFVGLKAISGQLNTFSATTDYGRDASVTVNGSAASVDGLHVAYRASDLDASFDLTKTVNKNNTSKTFGVTGGGATFALGSKVADSNNASIGIGSVSTGTLGDSVTGFLASLGSGGTNALTGNNLASAQKIVDAAVNQVSQLRGRLGAFQKYTLGSTINSLNVALENSSSALSAIRDTDFAAETSNLTRAQILSQASSTVLASANAAPQQALALLKNV